MKGMVARIQRFSITNGPGIRSTVFLKGCPLHCLWCHNPEMQGRERELMVFEKLCVSCGSCVTVCPNAVHYITDGLHTLERANCTLCETCVSACPHAAIDIEGEELTPEQVMDILRRDTLFYSSSGGGITLSGGEPLMQFDFTRSILQMAKAEGLHTCLDTSGWGGRAHELAPFVDLYLWDIKHTEPDVHKETTGVEFAPILKSLKKMDAAGASVQIRMCIISGINDAPENVDAAADIFSAYKCITGVDFVPYHRLGIAKSRALGKVQGEYAPPDDEKREKLLALMKARVNVPCKWTS